MADFRYDMLPPAMRDAFIARDHAYQTAGTAWISLALACPNKKACRLLYSDANLGAAMEAYAATTHELIRATGFAKRLNEVADIFSKFRAAVFGGEIASHKKRAVRDLKRALEFAEVCRQAQHRRELEREQKSQ